MNDPDTDSGNPTTASLKGAQAGSMTPIIEFRFFLHKHWSLYNSMIHSSYMFSKLNLWKGERGEVKLKVSNYSLFYYYIFIYLIIYFFSFRNYWLRLVLDFKIVVNHSLILVQRECKYYLLFFILIVFLNFLHFFFLALILMRYSAILFSFLNMILIIHLLHINLLLELD